MVSRQQSTTVGMLTSAGGVGGQAGGAEGGWSGAEEPGLVNVCSVISGYVVPSSQTPEDGSHKSPKWVAKEPKQDAPTAETREFLCTMELVTLYGVRGGVMFSTLSGFLSTTVAMLTPDLRNESVCMLMGRYLNARIGL
jgi:hypothetical protein